MLPSSDDSLLVRTDFKDDDAWERARSAALAENEDGFRAYVSIVDDRAWDGADWETLHAAAVAGEKHASVLFVVDQVALADDHAILVVDLEERRPPFRCIASRLWSVDNNLNISNMDWEEFAESTDSANVYRGF